MNQTGYSVRLIEFEAHDFRSLHHVYIENLPPVVLLYGDNDTGKSNLIQAVGVWLRIVQALAQATPQQFSLTDVPINLYENHEPDWSSEAPAEAPGPSVLLGKRAEELFRYGASQFELEGKLLLELPDGDAKQYQFGFRVNREQNGSFHCTVLTAIWPDGRRNRPILPTETDAKALRLALHSPWQQIGAERRFEDEQLPVSSTDDWGTAIDLSGCGLKLRLFRSAHGLEADRRALFREHFVPLLTGQPFALPEPLPVVSVNGMLELLLGDYPVEHRGSGPQQWVLMAGLLAMSQAAIAGLEEPEAHLSWEAQQRVAQALKALVIERSYPPYQLFVSTHSPLMKDMCSEDFIYYKTMLQNGETQIERSQDQEEFNARFASLAIDRAIPRRLLPANLVRLSDQAVEHLGAEPGEKLFEIREDDGSLRLLTVKRMGERLG
jgi:hypothetical protein